MGLESRQVGLVVRWLGGWTFRWLIGQSVGRVSGWARGLVVRQLGICAARRFGPFIRSAVSHSCERSGSPALGWLFGQSVRQLVGQSVIRGSAFI